MPDNRSSVVEAVAYHANRVDSKRSVSDLLAQVEMLKTGAIDAIIVKNAPGSNLDLRSWVDNQVKGGPVTSHKSGKCLEVRLNEKKLSKMQHAASPDAWTPDKVAMNLCLVASQLVDEAEEKASKLYAMATSIDPNLQGRKILELKIKNTSIALETLKKKLHEQYT